MTKAKTKSLASTSVTAAVNAALAVMEPEPQPPAHIKMRECDMVFWGAIIRARARDEWTENQLVIAAQLARCQADIEAQQQLLDNEGMVLEKLGRNDQVISYSNPRMSALEQLARRQIYLMRTMGMTGYVANGEKRNLQGKRQLEGEARRTKQEIEDDELLA